MRHEENQFRALTYCQELLHGINYVCGVRRTDIAEVVIICRYLWCSCGQLRLIRVFSWREFLYLAISSYLCNCPLDSPFQASLASASLFSQVVMIGRTLQSSFALLNHPIQSFACCHQRWNWGSFRGNLAFATRGLTQRSPFSDCAFSNSSPLHSSCSWRVRHCHLPFWGCEGKSHRVFLAGWGARTMCCS